MSVGSSGECIARFKSARRLGPAARDAQDDRNRRTTKSRTPRLTRSVRPSLRLLVPSSALRAEPDATALLVVTSGGTGISPRDNTPQATQSVLDYEVLGLAEMMRITSLQKTPMAALSRAVAGVRGRTLIINLPGSPKGVRECLEAILPVLPHALEQLASGAGH